MVLDICGEGILEGKNLFEPVIGQGLLQDQFSQGVDVGCGRQASFGVEAFGRGIEGFGSEAGVVGVVALEVVHANEGVEAEEIGFEGGGR